MEIKRIFKILQTRNLLMKKSRSRSTILERPFIWSILIWNLRKALFTKKVIKMSIRNQNNSLNTFPLKRNKWVVWECVRDAWGPSLIGLITVVSAIDAFWKWITTAHGSPIALVSTIISISSIFYSTAQWLAKW